MQFSLDDRRFLWLGLVVVALFFRQPLVAALLPFLLALLLSTVIDPLVGLIQKKTRLPRSVATAIGLVAVILAGGYITLIVSTKVLSELIQMGSLLQRYQAVPVELAASLIDALNRLNEAFDQRGLPAAVRENILHAVDDLSRRVIILITQGINFTINAASRLPVLVVVLVVAFIATYFIVKDKERLIESSLMLVPDAMRDRAREVQERLVIDLVGFIKAQLILLTLTSVTIGLGLALMGINYWLTLALVAGLLDAIPVVGPGFLMIPWAIGAWALGSPGLAFQLILLYTVSFLVRQLFQAKILGDFIGVHPLTMLIALYAGIHFFGLASFLIAPILVIIGKAIYQIKSDPRA